MKKLLIIAFSLVMIVGLAGGAFAAGSMSAGTKGISVGMGDSIFGDVGVVRITGKYFIDKDLALLLGFGFQTSTGDYDSDVFSIQAGIRKYLSTSDFAPFVGGRLTYEKVKITAPPAAAENVKTIDLLGEFGAEYFFSKQFSVEGSIGIGFGTQEDNTTNQDVTYFGTRTVGVSANFYF